MPSLSNRNRVIPLRESNAVGESSSFDEGHDLALSEEERQLQDDINRAIELSLIEQQLLDHYNESLKAAGGGAPTGEGMGRTVSANAKDEPSSMENHHSPRAYSPSAKTPRHHAGLNRTYTEYSEGEIGISGYAANSSHLDIINSIPSNFDNNCKMSAVLSTPPRSRQASQNILPGVLDLASVVNTQDKGVQKSPSKAMMDFSQPRVVADEEENTEVRP